MYITSDLFASSDPLQGRGDSPTTQNWNIMAETRQPMHLGKRKRRMDVEETLTTSPCFRQTSPASNKMFKYSANYNHSPADLPYKAATGPMFEARPLKQPRHGYPKKATLVRSSSHLMDIVTESSSSTNTPSTNDLRPCHICHKAPMRKRELENYIECQGCGERACYVCARACAGGCYKKLCSTCCIEVGEDGDTWCGDCFSRYMGRP
ncbi:hypothetical protein K469DRAFT_737936 [Zopfia rhizophila CBS 207.26]|uniref:Uncharacterized protein n=1 Tax=Zopfia rhizophila CBS 207.26 TaxID=1314779 RepID=A0A6A6EBA8_9PEZI|nr:hypothetical protein K469DRAFT_737936 [Zopfia rhizophila CBS 207.26]